MFLTFEPLKPNVLIKNAYTILNSIRRKKNCLMYLFILEINRQME